MFIRKQPKPRNVHLPSNWHRNQQQVNKLIENTPKMPVNEFAQKLLNPHKPKPFQ